MKATLKLYGEIPAKKNRQRAVDFGKGRLGVVKADVVREVEDMVAGEVIGQKIPPFHDKEVQLKCEIVYRRNRDIDGVLTTAMDCLQFAGVYDNDMQVVRVFTEKRKAEEEEKTYTLITIATLEEEL